MRSVLFLVFLFACMAAQSQMRNFESYYSDKALLATLQKAQTPSEQTNGR